MPQRVSEHSYRDNSIEQRRALLVAVRAGRAEAAEGHRAQFAGGFVFQIGEFCVADCAQEGFLRRDFASRAAVRVAEVDDVAQELSNLHRAYGTSTQDRFAKFEVAHNPRYDPQHSAMEESP